MKCSNVYNLSSRARRWGLAILVVTVLGTACAAQAALVQYWKFDDGAGTTAANSVGGGLPGTLMAGELFTAVVNPTPIWSAEKPAALAHSTGSLQFEDSLSEWVNVGVLGMLCDNQSTSLHGTTVSMWVKPNSLPSSYGAQLYDWTGVGQSSLHDPLTSNNGNVGGPQARADGSISIMGRDDDGTGYEWTHVFAPAGSITTDNWHHVAVTHIGDRAYCYVDGQLSDIVGAYMPFTFDNTAEFGIGCKRRVLDNPQQNSFDGLMDDVAIWNKALTPAAIAQLAAGADPTTIVERPAQPEYSQIINVDVTWTKSGYDPLPTYTGKGAIPATGTIWNETVGVLGDTTGDRDQLLTNAVDSQGNATAVDVSFIDFYAFEHSTTTGPYGTPPHPLNGDRMWARAGTYLPEEWFIDDLEVGATYDIYFLGAKEGTIAVASGATPTSAQILADDADADFKVINDLPEDWVEGINYAVLTVTPTSTTVAGTITPDEDGSPTTHIYGIQIAKRVGTTPIPGDTNNDGKVNEADARKVAENWGRSDVTGPAYGDFNSDSKVNAADASILAANWLVGTSSESSTAPEPSTFAWFLSLSLAWLIRRRH